MNSAVCLVYLLRFVRVNVVASMDVVPQRRYHSSGKDHPHHCSCHRDEKWWGIRMSGEHAGSRIHARGGGDLPTAMVPSSDKPAASRDSALSLKAISSHQNASLAWMLFCMSPFTHCPCGKRKGVGKACWSIDADMYVRQEAYVELLP